MHLVELWNPLPNWEKETVAGSLCLASTASCVCEKNSKKEVPKKKQSLHQEWKHTETVHNSHNLRNLMNSVLFGWIVKTHKDNMSDLGNNRVAQRPKFESALGVLKKVLSTLSNVFLISNFPISNVFLQYTMWFHAKRSLETLEKKIADFPF